MKPESIQCLFDCYLKEKRDRTSHYDVVDGVMYTRRMAPHRLESISGEPGEVLENRLSELHILEAQGAILPYPPHYEPLPPHQEEIVRAFGRQLSDIVDDYEMGRSSHEYRSSSDGNEKLQFLKQCWFFSRKDSLAKIKIVRLGNSNGTTTITWKTKDDTAYADMHYVKAEEDVVFNEGEVNKDINIKLLGNHQDKDIKFFVELLDSDGIEIGSINPVAVHITDHENLYDDERQVVENIVEAQHFSLANVKSCLMDKVTVNTFKTALIYACSNADSIPQEFAYAFELLRFALPAARRESLMRVVCNFFQRAPELDDLEQYLPKSDIKSEDSEESEEDSDESEED